MQQRTRHSSKPSLPNPFEDVYGRRQVKYLERFLDQLRERERQQAHGNRKVFLSDLFVAQLLAFHYPTVRSLRTLDVLSTSAAAQEVLQADRLSRSTVSDANKVVDASLLQPLLKDLMHRVQGNRLPKELDVLVKRLVAVDGTFLRIVSDLAWTLSQRTDNGRIISKPRLDTQLDVASGIPRFAVLSGHVRSECNAARLHVEPGKIYVGDKAYFGFDLLNDWLDGGADFVVALNSQIRFEPEEDLTPDAEDILSDRIGRLPGCEHSRPPKQQVREVIICRDDGQTLRILTSLVDPQLTADQIRTLYRRRWHIELFFRWLKSCANFRHAISHSQNGLSAALYVALIATLLSTIVSGRAPSKYTLLAMQLTATGMADMQSMQPALERLERERELARIRREKKRRSAR